MCPPSVSDIQLNSPLSSFSTKHFLESSFVVIYLPGGKNSRQSEALAFLPHLKIPENFIQIGLMTGPAATVAVPFHPVIFALVLTNMIQSTWLRGSKK